MTDQIPTVATNTSTQTLPVTRVKVVLLWIMSIVIVVSCCAAMGFAIVLVQASLTFHNNTLQRITPELLYLGELLGIFLSSLVIHRRTNNDKTTRVILRFNCILVFLFSAFLAFAGFVLKVFLSVDGSSAHYGSFFIFAALATACTYLISSYFILFIHSKLGEQLAPKITLTPWSFKKQLGAVIALTLILGLYAAYRACDNYYGPFDPMCMLPQFPFSLIFVFPPGNSLGIMDI